MEDAISGAEIASRLLALAVARLPLCLWQGSGPVLSQLALLWYSLNPLFCEPARLCLTLELFVGKFSLSLSFSPLSLAIPQFGLLSSLRLAPSDCPQVTQARSLPYECNLSLPIQPPLAGGGHGCLGYFSAGSYG